MLVGLLDVRVRMQPLVLPHPERPQQRGPVCVCDFVGNVCACCLQQPLQEDQAVAAVPLRLLRCMELH